ncbi:MAG TPA: STAS domain-containing protein [Thermoleophilaceae bacterium]|jgi:anti-anti-sigma factor
MAEIATLIVERRDDLQLLRIAGEVDISNAGALEEDISAAVPNDAAGMVLDLSDTDYFDSAGIRMLFELAQRLEGRRQSLTLVVPAESLIRHSLIVTEVEQAMAVHETLDGAVEAMRTE